MALAVRSEFELLTVAYETSDFSHEDGLDRHKITWRNTFDAQAN